MMSIVCENVTSKRIILFSKNVTMGFKKYYRDNL